MRDPWRVKQAIVGFHQDEHGDWVADLACGHTRHMRHNPPWIERPWVTTPEGRQRFLGTLIGCKACDEALGLPPSDVATPGI